MSLGLIMKHLFLKFCDRCIIIYLPIQPHLSFYLILLILHTFSLKIDICILKKLEKRILEISIMMQAQKDIAVLRI